MSSGARPSTRERVRGLGLLGLATFTLACAGLAQLASLQGLEDRGMRSALRTIARESAPTVAEVWIGEERVAMATAVGTHALVTKASEVLGEDGGVPPIVCRLPNGERREASFVAWDREVDLALLSLADGGLEPARWHVSPEPRGSGPAVGAWVLSAGRHSDPLALGVVGVAARPIAPRSGFLGIYIENSRSGPVVGEVIEDTVAEAIGMQAGDRVLSIDDERVANRTQLIATIREHRVGEPVRLRIERGEEELELTAILGEPAAGLAEPEPQFAGPVSRVRSGFPLAFQHDGVLRPYQVGGPLLDLDGRVVGLNIARGGRTHTFALPASELVRVLASWESNPASAEDSEESPR